MKKVILGSIPIILGFMVFGSVASADTIEVDTTAVPSVGSFFVEDDYIDLNSLVINLDNKRYSVIDKKLVPSVESFDSLNSIAPRAALQWSSTLDTGYASSRTWYPGHSPLFRIFGSEPASGGTSNRRTEIFRKDTSTSNDEKVFDFTTVTGRWEVMVPGTAYSLRCNVTNLSERQLFNFWYDIAQY